MDQVEMNMRLTQDAVLAFLKARSGKVRNAELLSAFTAHISCSEHEQRKHNRDLFKSFINNVAVVKRVDGVKYVVLKKKYQEMINEGQPSIASSSSSSSSSSCTTTHQSCFSKCEFLPITSADVVNNNSWFHTNLNGSNKPTNQRQLKSDESEAPVTSPIQEQTWNAQVLKVPNNTRNHEMGSVFAVVTIKSPPCSRSEEIKYDHGIRARPQRFEIPPREEVKTILRVEESSPYPNHEPDLNKSPGIERRPMAGRSRAAPERGNKVDPPGFNGTVLPVFGLEPQEHEWLVKSATGCWSQVYSLLLQNIHLAEKRSFISGFTALHWAAKHGNSKTVRRILDVGEKVDVDLKSYDGYTPLHLAAIHSHESVLNVLVREYGANFNIRDNSGKKAHQYLSKDLPAEVRALLGDPSASGPVTGDQHLPEWSTNPNTFTKLFQGSLGRRKKSKHRLSFRFLGDDQENRKDWTSNH